MMEILCKCYGNMTGSGNKGLHFTAWFVKPASLSAIYLLNMHTCCVVFTFLFFPFFFLSSFSSFLSLPSAFSLYFLQDVILVFNVFIYGCVPACQHLCVRIYVSVRVPSEARRAEKEVRSLGAGAIGGCERSCGGWEPNRRVLQERQELNC